VQVVQDIKLETFQSYREKRLGKSGTHLVSFNDVLLPYRQVGTVALLLKSMRVNTMIGRAILTGLRVVTL